MATLQNDTTNYLLAEIAELLRDIKNWAYVIGFPTIKLLLETALDTDEKKIVYDLSDGKRSTKEIVVLSGVNNRYVSEWGQKWEAIGILGQSRSTTIKGRRQKLFDLTNFGMSIPDKFSKQQDEK